MFDHVIAMYLYDNQALINISCRMDRRTIELVVIPVCGIDLTSTVPHHAQRDVGDSSLEGRESPDGGAACHAKESYESRKSYQGVQCRHIRI